MTLPKTKIQALARGIHRMNSETQLQPMMRALVEAALEMVPSESATWGVRINDGIVFTDLNKAGEWKAVDARFEAGEGVPGCVLKEGKPHISNDPASGDIADKALLEAHSIRNLIDLPILDRDGSVLGCFELHNKMAQNKAGEADYLEDDLLILDALSAAAAVQLTNTRLLEEIESDHVERAHFQAQLQLERERIAEVFRQAPVFIAVLRGPQHTFELVNPAYEQLIGKRRVLGMTVRQALPELEGQGLIEKLDHVFKTGEPFTAEGRPVLLARSQQGSESGEMEQIYVDFVYQPVRELDGTVSGIIALGNEVTDRVQAHAELERSREEERKRWAEIETIYRTAPIGLALFDPVEFRYTRLNDRQAEIMGLPKEEILGKELTEIAPIEGLREMFEQVAAGRPLRDALLEGELPTRPGEHRYWRVNYDPVYGPDGKVQAISAASLEITAQKRAEMALVQNEKLAAAGRLAASIAHEINNPLEAVTNLIYLIQSGSTAEETRRFAEMAAAELARVSQITLQTLRFHRQSTSPTRVKLSDLLESVLALYQGRFYALGIKLERRYEDEPITCLESEMRQVMNNLIGNALDAMPGGGRLSLRTRAVRNGANGSAGVRLLVADSGHGMDAATRKRIFEPFFTTKGVTGTGLGLWVSAGILRRHGARVRVRSCKQAGRSGTTFSIFLPGENALLTPSN